MLIKYLRLIWAFVRALLILWFEFPKFNREQKLQSIKNWSNDVLSLLNIDVYISRDESVTLAECMPRLIVSNHVSWIDVLIIQSLQPSIFVAKKEVRDWPLIGIIAKACGVIFVDRGSVQSAKNMVVDVSTALAHGYSVAAFPEGTSSHGYQVSLFHANLFEAAVHQQISVRPITLRYCNANTKSLCTDAAFVDDYGFLHSLHKIITLPSVTVEVHVGTALSSLGHSRRTLAHLSHRYVSSQLQRLNA